MDVNRLKSYFTQLWSDKSRFLRFTAIVAAVATFASLIVFASTNTQASTQIVSPRFNGPTNGITEATANNWVVGGSRTGGTWTPIMVDGPDADTTVDRLQLVDRQTNEVGFALYDVAQSTSAGLDIQFNLAMYDGGGANTNAADGITFFIKDGTDTGNDAASLGARCEALGYAARQTNDSCRNNGNFGLSGGLLGIGFDARGDSYSNASDGVGCASPSPSSVGTFSQKLIIRGPQGNTRSDGYCRIFTTQDGTNSSVNTGISLTGNSMFTSAGSAVRITVDTEDQSGGRNNGTVRVYIAAAGTTNWSNVTETTIFEIPEALSQANTFKFGFTAGTGGNFMRGEIWGPTVESIRDLPPPTWTSNETMCSVTNVAFSQRFQVVDGVAPYSYARQSGSLPPGLSLSTAGVLSGTPTTSGTYTFTVRVTDSSIGTRLTADRTFTMTIQSNECSTLSVSMAATRQITGASTDFNFENRITLPGSWAASQHVAVEVALTSENSDTAQTYRGPGSCGIDISSSTTAGVYGTTQSNGSQTLSGGSGAIWVMNDRTSQLTLYGRADYVRQALKNVRAYCATVDDLNGKFVRLGAVPTESPTSVTLGSTATDIGMFYVFSTQHYYTFRRIPATPQQGGTWATNFTRISQMMENARYDRITVDGRFINVSGDSRRNGWVATLTSQDEIRLTEAFRPSGFAGMIGLTDVGTTTTNNAGNNNQPDAQAATWNWDTTRWGTMPTTQAGQTLSSSCTTKEGNYRWLGPDAWCQQVPAKRGTQADYWSLDTTNRTWSVGTSTNRTIDLTSTNTDCSLDPCNGYDIHHMWHLSGNAVGGTIDEPNQSGDFIYSGYGGSFWDDAAPADGYEITGALNTAAPLYYFSEYCSPANGCAPADEAVASTLLTAVDSSVRLSWEVNGATPTPPTGTAQDTTCTNGTISQRTVGDYRTVSITASGLGNATCTWTAPTGVSNVEVFLVGGGGGGGGDAGAGGGGGGQTLHSSFRVGATATITLGAGGAGGAGSGTVSAKGGAAGTNTTFTSNGTTITGFGGAGGGGCNFVNNFCQNNNAAASGGSSSSTNGTRAIAGGNGGRGIHSASNGPAAQAGSNGSSWQNSGNPRIYGGGGAGGGSGVLSGGTGGGASSVSSGTPANATANTGGGGAGGAGNAAGSRGGSGLVVIKYSLPSASNAVSTTTNLTVTSNNAISTGATVKRQYATLTDSTCGTSWTTETVNITTFPNTSTLERGRCYRWTVDPGLASGAVRPIDSASASPTTNLTSPVLLIPNEAVISTAAVVSVDPRNSHVNLAPLIPVSSGPPRLQVCLYEYGNGSTAPTGLGAVAASPTVTFDLGTAGSVQTTLNGATLGGDRTSAVSIQGTRQQVQDAVQTIRVNASTGRLNSSKYILLRTVPFIEGFTSTCGESGAQLTAQSSGVLVVEIKPLELGTTKDVEILIE